MGSGAAGIILGSTVIITLAAQTIQFLDDDVFTGIGITNTTAGTAAAVQTGLR